MSAEYKSILNEKDPLTKKRNAYLFRLRHGKFGKYELRDICTYLGKSEVWYKGQQLERVFIHNNLVYIDNELLGRVGRHDNGNRILDIWRFSDGRHFSV